MKSLLSVVIVLMVGSAFAQTNQQNPPAGKDTAPTAAKEQTVPADSTTKASPSLANPAPVDSQSLPTTPSATSATSANPENAQVTTPDVSGEVGAEGAAPVVSTINSLPAGALINFGATYYSRKLDETVNASIGTHGDVNLLVGELKAGYVFDFGLFVGATGHYDSGKANGNSIKTVFAGPTVGYSDSYTGFLAAVTYHVFGNMDLDAAGKYDKVSGLQVDLAYPLAINDKLKFGPQLSFRDMKQEEGDTGLADDKSKELVPFVGIWYVF